MSKSRASCSIDDAVRDHSVFNNAPDRLITHEALTELFNATLNMAVPRGLLPSFSGGRATPAG